jgi:hypothetical protein
MDKKISQLDPAAALDGTELLAVVQGGSTLKSTISAINTYLTGIFTPLTRQLTINGTTYDLSANRSWTVDTLPSQSGQNGKYLTTDGATASWATISTAVETLAQTLGAGNTSGAYDILMNTTQRIGFKDGDNTYTTYISNNQSQAGNRTVYLPLFDGQIAYHATGSPLTTNYVLKGTTNGAITSSSLIFDNGTNVGINQSSPSATTHIKGATSATGAYALMVDNSSNSPLLHIANTINGQANGLNQGNGNLVMYYDTSGAGYAVLRSLNYNSVAFGTHAAPDRIVLERDGNISLNDRTFINGGSIASVTETLSVGNTTHGVNGSTSSMVVLNITMGAANSGLGLFAIGATGSGGTTGNATMNFQYNPVSYGGTVNSTNNNYYRVAIGKSPSTDYRLEISGGLRIESDANTTSTALLELSSTTQGVLLPRMTTTQRNAISTPANGLEIYNTSTTSPNYYDGTTWQQVTNKAYVDTNIVSAQVPAKLFNYYNFI